MEELTTTTTTTALAVANGAHDANSAIVVDDDDAAAEDKMRGRDTKREKVEVVEEGCCPYLQIFKGGKLIFTTTWADAANGHGVSWASTTDGSISFHLDCMLQGDILIRCRHVSDTGQRISMFRAAFHTGYIPMGILRYVSYRSHTCKRSSMWRQLKTDHFSRMRFLRGPDAQNVLLMIDIYIYL